MKSRAATGFALELHRGAGETLFMFMRRFFILAPLGLFLAISSCGSGAGDESSGTREDRLIAAELHQIAMLELADAPEMATRLGLPKETIDPAVHARLTDRSQAGYERARLTRLEISEALARLPAPSAASRFNHDLDVINAAYKTAEDLAVFGHGQTELGVSYPYVMDHMRGAYIDVPDLLTRYQPVRDKAGAEAYLSRLKALGDAIDDERRRLAADAKAGIAPPPVILQRMERAAARMGSGPAETHILAETYESLLTGPQDMEASEREALLSSAIETLRTDTLPAYVAMRAQLNALMQDAPDRMGMWQMPDGSAYYAAVLKAYTYPAATPDILHETGKREVARLTAELDTALIAEGLIEGSVGERLALLAAREDQVFSDDEEGRAALMAALEAALAEAESRLPRLFARVPETPVTIRPVPDYLMASSPSAYYTPAPADGSAPAIFSINLQSMSDWPAFSLPTLVYHEILPGHHAESAITAEEGNLPLLRQLMWNTAYGEGWAVYAEELADEAGLYQDDPLGRIGYLQSMLFRAARLVADTGLHEKRWSRAETISYLASTTGQSEAAMADEVDRYAVWPGQAAAYWTGRTEIRALRERAETVLGPRFDLAAFHHAILSGGPRPLPVLEDDIERWYQAQMD